MRHLLAILSLALSMGCAATQDAPPPAATRSTQLKHVASKDGTLIAVECVGEGPTLLIAHGGVGDRSRWTPLLADLAVDRRACAIDRRGRGGSGDTTDYGMHKEAEDIAAVAESFGAPVYVMGHSYGGVGAYEATFLTPSITALILYEAPFMDPVDRNLAVAEKVEGLLAQDHPEDALIAFQTEIVGQSAEEISRMKARPGWPVLVETIKVHPRQMRALAAYRFDPDRMKTVTLPVLLLLGEDTGSPYLKQSMKVLADTFPHATLKVLAGQQHNAMDSGRGTLTHLLNDFLAGLQA